MDLVEAKELNESLMKIGYKGAAKHAVIGYLKGCFGYGQNIDTAYEIARKWMIVDFGQDLYFEVIFMCN